MTELRVETYSLPGAPLGPENPLPIFRHPDPDHPMELQDSIPPHKRKLAGWQAGFRVLPYRMQDNYSRSRSEMNFQALVLENEFLRATFLPELGGRLVSLFDRVRGCELLSRNPVFQPANLAIRNAWFSGGIEWNIGHYGHTFHTCAPIFAAEICGPGGDPGLRLYEYERCKGLFWQIDFFLPPGSTVLAAYTRVVNPNPSETPFYWWTNVAVPEKPGVRVLAPGRQVIYVDFSGARQAYGWGELPNLPSLSADASYSTNFTYASEYFYQLEHAALPWEAALDESGSGFFEASTRRLESRKMFCWGTHSGGRRWQQFLAEPGVQYLEIQAGMTPTQGHGLPMPGRTSWDWLQVFGSFSGDPAQIHQPNYEAAIGYVDAALNRQFPPQVLEEMRAACAANCDRAAAKIIRQGSGWGALELARRKFAGEPDPFWGSETFKFPPASFTEEQRKWLDLLAQGSFLEPDPALLPGEWLIQPEWLAYLERMPRPNWFSLLHIGVMRMEQFDLPGAIRAWSESIQLRPSCWAYRNLAVAAQVQGELQTSLEYYDLARNLALAGGTLPVGLAVECLQALCTANRFQEALQLIYSLPEDCLQADRIQILFGRISLELGNLDVVEQVFGREYAVIREGETELTDLWADLWLCRESLQSGLPVDRTRRREILKKYPPPSSLDFRMF